MLASLFFVGQRILQLDLSFAFPLPVLGGLFFTALLIAINILFIAFFFWWLLQRLSCLSLPPFFCVKIYNQANVYKYIPGGFMSVLGRGRLSLAIKELSLAKVYGASFIEGVFSVFTAILLVAIISFSQLIEILHGLPALFWFIVVFAALTIIFLFGFQPVTDCNRLMLLTKKAKECFAGLNLRVSFWMVVRCLINLLLMASGFALVLWLLGYNMNGMAFLRAGSMFLLAWLAGFLTPGTSGGLGVREATLLLVMANVDDVLLLNAAITHRFLNILGDLLAYLFATIMASLKPSAQAY